MRAASDQRESIGTASADFVLEPIPNRLIQKADANVVRWAANLYPQRTVLQIT